MKRLLVGVGVLAMATVAHQALAADMPLLKAPAAAPVASGWNGWYVGGEVGGVTVNNTWNTNCVQYGAIVGGSQASCGNALNNTYFPGGPDSTANTSMKNSSLRPGIYAGAMFQVWNNWVLGIEGDYAFYNKTATVAGIPGCSTGACTGGQLVPFNLSGDSASIQNKNDGSLRLRGGFLVTQDVLLYATGGMAFTDFTTTATCNGATSPACQIGVHTDSNSGFVAGYTVGGGVEWKIFQNWLLRGEYRYNHYGDLNSHYFVGSGSGAEFFAKTNATAQIATAGLAYMFPIPR
jgi:outer membrane immunogenic protein